MAGIRWPPEDAEVLYPGRAAPGGGAAELVSDDDRSVAADSWSIKSDYGSTLDDDQRHADACEILSGSHYPPASDYSSDKDGPDANEVETSMLGLQSYWDATYAEDLANFNEHGNAGEVWFGVEVMDVIATWTKDICLNLSRGQDSSNESSRQLESNDTCRDLSSWNVLDIGTGNGLLLQELAKQGFSDLTGTDYSEGAIELAQNLAARNGFSHINFLCIVKHRNIGARKGVAIAPNVAVAVDDVLETKLGRQFKLVMDKGTFDAIGLHPDGPVKRMAYWESVSNLVAPGGILVITSCNNTKNELLQEVESFNQRRLGSQDLDREPGSKPAAFRYLNHVQTHPTVIFGGAEGSRIATAAFQRS